MENDAIQLLTYALILIALGSANLYAIAKGLPQARAAYREFWLTVVAVAPIMRRLFDPDTRLSVALREKGINPQIADMVAELGADMLVRIARPYLPERVSENYTPPAKAILKGMQAIPPSEATPGYEATKDIA